MHLDILNCLGGDHDRDGQVAVSNSVVYWPILKTDGFASLTLYNPSLVHCNLTVNTAQTDRCADFTILQVILRWESL